MTRPDGWSDAASCKVESGECRVNPTRAAPVTDPKGAVVDSCFLCGQNRCQPCTNCGAGMPVCEPCLRDAEGLRCPVCQAAKAAGKLDVVRLVMYAYRMREERADLWNTSPDVYAEDEPAWE